MPKRLLQKQAIDFFEKNGYFVLCGTYKNSRNSSFDLMDSDGYKYRKTYDDFKQSINLKTSPERFDYRNPFVMENIDVLIKKKDLQYDLLPNQHISKDKKSFYCKCRKCPENEIPFLTTVANIHREYGCPLCQGIQIGKYNNLEYLFPEITRDWDYIKNGDIIPSNCAPKSHLSVYWTCPNGHQSYSTEIASRTSGNTGCPICGGNLPLGIEFVSKTLSEYGYKLFSTEYKNSTDTVLHFSDSDGYKYGTSFSSFKICVMERKQGIKRFSVNNPYSLENIDFYTKKTDSQFIVLGGEYLGRSYFSILCQCRDCGVEYKTSWRNIVSRVCKYCNHSQGEKRIFRFLKDRIGENQFVPEHVFQNCINKTHLPFDFYLPHINTCIEYDGVIHYKNKFGNAEEFEKIKLRDKIKTNYCIENGINLIRIPYWEFDNIEEILKKELNLQDSSI